MGGLQSLRLRPNPEDSAELAVDWLPGRAPCLVFLHGMTSTRVGCKSSALQAQAEAAGLGFACFDFRGHGDSGGKLESLTISDLITDTRCVLAKVGPAVLVGSSMGGLAAAWTAATTPDKVPALALLSPALGFIPLMAAAAAQQRPFPLRRADEEVVFLDQATLEDASRYDEPSLPAQLQMPLFMAHGLADQTVPSKLSTAFCAAVPHQDKECWLLEGGSHSLNEDVDTVMDRLMRFLASHGLA